MANDGQRIISLVAGLAWLGVAAYGFGETRVDGGLGHWSYVAFNVALLIGSVLIVAAASWATQEGGRRGLRRTGLIVSCVGVAATLVAWALPLWMTVIGVGLVMVAIASGRRFVALLALGQVAGIAALFVGIAAEVGEPDGYGDYPAAVGIALIATAAITIVALVEFTRGQVRHPAPHAGATRAASLTAIE